MSINRRSLIKLLPAAIASSLLVNQPPVPLRATSTHSPRIARHYQGTNLSGWEVTLGDALYVRPGECPVTLRDIETVHEPAHSELRANLQRRIILVHNITFKQMINNEAMHFIHTCIFKFRLPYLPTTDVNADLNAQTFEGGIFVWDGSQTRLDYGMAFQWGLNPWIEGEHVGAFGVMSSWTTTHDDDGTWRAVGHLTPDTEWHEVKMVVNYPGQTTALWVDNKHYGTQFTSIPKPDTWGTEIAARFQVEIISIYPEPTGLRAMHQAQVKDWSWTWKRAHGVFLPTIRK
ncbi:hypothetical protein [Candidatus Chloroploca asiatica]|uniref:hypothetical protein n=1 Tax=Candidatus Chloroploca asiatica TaxID=1506545 RepID=UPI0011445EB3|nr:hypothetical protein [Candidatus Chloroploca asiatica]